MKEKRNQQVKFWASNAEIQIIQNRKESAGFRCLGAYLRKMAMDGYIIVIDLSDVKEAIRLLRINANNLNQYAKRANETGSIYEADVKELQESHKQILKMMGEILERLSSIE